jgi:hypothetical protein
MKDRAQSERALRAAYEAAARWREPATRATVRAAALARSSFGWSFAAAIASALLLSTAAARAQAGGCELVADERNPPEKILRCGDALAVRPAHQTEYHPVDQTGNAPPNAIQLDSGALMIEFHPSNGRRHFQILTPNAIATVRGTKWVVEVAPARTSTFVIAGRVSVSRPHGEQAVLLRPGEGADVTPDGGPIVVKRWARPRVQTLLARFGE